MALTEDEELELLELEELEANSQQSSVSNAIDNPTNLNKTDILGNQYERGELNILGNIFNRPGAAIRSQLMGRGYIQGANVPEEVPTFHQLSLDTPISNRPDQPIQNFRKGIIRDAAAMVGDVITNPADMGLSLLTGGASRALSSTRHSNLLRDIIKGNPDKLIKKAEKLTTELLSPTKSELANAIQRGDQLSAVKETVKIIKKSKDLSQVKSFVKDAISQRMSLRDEILKLNNYDIQGSQYISKLEHELIRQIKLGQATPAEIRQMKEVLAREEAFITKNGGRISRLDAQARKEYLQDQTERLLVRDAQGINTSTDPARSRALDALREGLKEAVEGGDKQVRKLNSSYDGLKRADRLLSEQEAIIQRTIPLSKFEEVINIIKEPKDSLIARLLGHKSIPRQTSNIEKLMRRASKIKGQL